MDERAPWDQMEGEPAPAYARFLSYRNLGPSRTILRAEAALNNGKPKEKGSKPGSTWAQDSATYGWVARADAWDVSNLQRAGEQFVVRFVEILRRYSLRTLEAIEAGSIKPNDWRSLTEAVTTLSAFVSPAALAAVAANGRADGPRTGSAGTEADPQFSGLALGQLPGDVLVLEAPGPNSVGDGQDDARPTQAPDAVPTAEAWEN